LNGIFLVWDHSDAFFSGLPENLWVESERWVASAPGESTCCARPPLRCGPTCDTPSATAVGWLMAGKGTFPAWIRRRWFR